MTPSRPFLRPVLAAMGACTLPGFLTLVAIFTDGNIRLDKLVWFLLAAGGGLVGWCLGTLALYGRFGLR